MNRVSTFYRKIAREFARRVMHELGSKVQAIILYGSVARGEANRSSDIDLLVLTCDQATIHRQVTKLEVNAAAQYNYEPWPTSVYLSPHEVRYLSLTGSPFIREVMEEGISLYDDGTFARLRNEVFGHIEECGPSLPNTWSLRRNSNPKPWNS